MAKHYISGVWKDSANAITHVLLHKTSDTGGILPGFKTNEAQVIALLDAKDTVKTIVWSYQKANWEIEADVSYEVLKGKNYLRSIKDGKVTNNLDNIIKFNHFVSCMP